MFSIIFSNSAKKFVFFFFMILYLELKNIIRIRYVSNLLVKNFSREICKKSTFSVSMRKYPFIILKNQINFRIQNSGCRKKKNYRINITVKTLLL